MSAILGKVTALFCSGRYCFTARFHKQAAVGYQNKELTSGEYNCLSATFLPVGKDGKDMKLGEVTASADFAFGADTVMFLAANGATEATFTYVGEEEAKSYNTAPGWYDYNYVMGEEWDWSSQIPEPYQGNNVDLPYGMMVIVQASTSDATINYAGEVLAVNKQFELVSGEYNMLGNATPVDITLGDISAGNGFGFGSDTIMFLAANGATKSTWTFVGEEEAKSYNTAPGWYDYNYVMGEEWDWGSQIPEPYQGNGIELDAGDGFIVQASVDKSYIELPKAY